MSDMRVDADRVVAHEDRTGFYVRAIGADGRWGSFDMAQLDRQSFIKFVSRGEAVPQWTLSILLGLFGYDREAPTAPIPEGSEQ